MLAIKLESFMSKPEGDGSATAPFDQGVVAARTGVARDANPFEAKSRDYSDWNAGYDAFKDADDAVEPKNI